MGFLKDYIGTLKDDKKRRDTCCSNCRFFNAEKRSCKKDLSYIYKQPPYEPCECPKFDSKIW